MGYLLIKCSISYLNTFFGSAIRVVMVQMPRLSQLALLPLLLAVLKCYFDPIFALISTQCALVG